MSESNKYAIKYPSGHRFFKNTLHIFSLVAAIGFLFFSRANPYSVGFTLLATAVPAAVYFLLLLLVVYRRSHLRWVLLRHMLDTFLKVGFLLSLAPLMSLIATEGWFTALSNLIFVLVGVLVGFVLFSLGIETLLKRLLGEHVDAETEEYDKELKQLDTLSHWKIALFLIPDLQKKKRRHER
jgi:hypothetical protein